MRHFLILPLTALAVPALAEPAPPTLAAETQESGGADPTPPDETLTREGNEILVVATRLRGSVEAPQVPVVTLDEADIASYGAASLSDLITALGPQTSSGRGRGGGFPVILVNGQRIANFREMRNYPPEAIRKVEVLPEEVALRFGYPANQRVINLILKDNYGSRTVEADYGAPTRGGYSTSEFEASLLRIDGPRRVNLTFSADNSSPLTEAERNLIQTTPGAPSVAGDLLPAEFRTLVADSRDLGINATWTTGLGQGANSGQLSLNAAINRKDTRSLSGLDSVVLTSPSLATAYRTLADPLERTSRTVSVQGGTGLNLPLGSWQLSATLDASHSETDTRIDRRADTSALVAAAASGSLPITGLLPALTGAGADQALTNADSATALVTLIGRPLRLPAGEVSATFKTGFAYTAIASRDTRTTSGPTSLKRGDLSAGVNIGVPIASRRENSLAALGDLNLNFSAGVDRLSDFGTLTDWSAGATWSPTEKLGFQASYLVNEAAPSLADLGNPQVLTFNVPVYDFTRGETSLVTILSGGNSALLRETQRDLKFGVTWQLPFPGNSNFIAEYFDNHSRNVTASFPILTPAIEAAFRDRVIRDPATGQLTAIDRRPVTFAETSGSRLRYGFNVSGDIGKPMPGAGGGLLGGLRGAGGGPGPGGAGPGAGGGGRGPGGGGPGGMFGGGNGQGRWNLSLYHTVRFSEQVVVAPGRPVLDLLGGDALTGGGVAKHTLELEGGAFSKGIGVRVAGRYTAPTTVRSTGLPGASDLRFNGLAGFDLRLFADLGQQKSLTDFSPFFKGTRLSLRVDNVFDARQRVTDAGGTIPLSYQPDYLDPKGRFIQIEFRKMF